MKKSEMYKVAMMAVVGSNSISPNVKVDVVRELMDKESLEQWREEQAEKEEEETKSKMMLELRGACCAENRK